MTKDAADTPVHIAGILVQTAPEQQDAVAAEIDALPWAEVHHRDPDGRMIVVIEGADEEQEVARLMALRAVPRVLGAAPVMHYFDDGGKEGAGDGSRPEEVLNDPTLEAPQSHYRRLKALGSG